MSLEGVSIAMLPAGVAPLTPEPHKGLKTVAEVAFILEVDYVTFCKLFQHGFIPFVRGNRNNRLVTPETLERLKEIRAAYSATDWFKHLEFDGHEKPNTRPPNVVNKSYPNGFEMPKPFRPNPTPSQSQDPLVTNLVNRARALKEQGRFEAACELLFALVDENLVPLKVSEEAQNLVDQKDEPADPSQANYSSHMPF